MPSCAAAPEHLILLAVLFQGDYTSYVRALIIRFERLCQQRVQLTGQLRRFFKFHSDWFGLKCFFLEKLESALFKVVVMGTRRPPLKALSH